MEIKVKFIKQQEAAILEQETETYKLAIRDREGKGKASRLRRRRKTKQTASSAPPSKKIKTELVGDYIKDLPNFDQGIKYHKKKCPQGGSIHKSEE